MSRPIAAGRYLLLGFFSLASVLPIVLVVSTALKSRAEVRADPFSLFTSFSLENLNRVWTQVGFDSLLWNSIALVVPVTALTVVLSTMAGYSVARCVYRGRTVAYYTILIALLVPFFAVMTPLFFQLRRYGLLDSRFGVIMILTTLGLPLGVFLMQAFFRELPGALEQAGRLDGCNEWQLFRYIMVPLIRPAAASLAVLTFLTSWNNLLVPLLYMPSGRSRPLSSGLYLLVSGQGSDYGALAAGSLIMAVPVMLVFVVAQRHLVRGLTAGAMKG